MKKKLSHKMLVRFLSEDELTLFKESAMEGNIQAKIEIIIHNQRIVNDKLNKLLKKK